MKKTETVTFRIATAEKQKLFERAKKDKRTLSNFITKKLSDDSK